MVLTTQPAQMTGLNGYTVNPLFTVGESIDDYTPPGILDGIGAFSLDDNTVRVLVNHELTADAGYAYELANGTSLTGARVSFLDIDKASREIVDAGLAYDTIINRQGEVVNEAADLEFGGLNRFCSAQYVMAEQFGEDLGFADNIFFTGEETDGGTEFALNVGTGELWAVPWMGRAAWENVTELNTGVTDKVALLVGDDRAPAPLLLFVGEKDLSEGAGFLERNGLAQGDLFVWVADNGVTTPEEFNGTGNSLTGSYVEIEHYREDLVFDTDLNGDGIFDGADINGDGSITADEVALHIDANGDGVFDGIDVDGDGTFDYDSIGFATQDYQDFLVQEVGGFLFSRPEDVATNPEDGTQAVMASTGRGQLYPSDDFGTTYRINTAFDETGVPLSAALEILYDGDDAGNGQFQGGDFGLRSPDNVAWADDGNIYIQEDRSTSINEFGGASGEEASIWKLTPETGELVRIAQMNRAGVPGEPIPQTDSEPNDIGNWESSGILDVSDLFGEAPGNLFIFGVQAHSLEDGVIETEGLVQGGQLAFLSSDMEPPTPIGNVTLGNFDILFDNSRMGDMASGLVVSDNADFAGTPLFDISFADASVGLGPSGVFVDGADLLLSPEFANVLEIPDAAGTDLGDARLDLQVSLENMTLQVSGGLTSVALDLDTIEAAAGLTLAGVSDTVDPANDLYQVGFPILDGSDFSISLNGLSGAIQHSGTVAFEMV
jgi:hypothetical protein